MAGRPRVVATAGQCEELRALAGSSDREEADRARAILLSLDGWSSLRIAEAFSVKPDSVRHWRWTFGREGISGLRARTAPGAAAGESEGGAIGRHGGVVGRGLGSAELDVAAAAGRDRDPNRAADLEIASQRGDAQKGGFRWRRPRHTLKRRQDALAIDRSGLRLRLLEQQAKAGDIVLLFADESEALTHPYLAHAWAKRGADLRVEAPGQARKVAMLGALDVAAGKLIVDTSRTKRSSDFIALLTRLDELYGPRPGRQTKPVVLVLDNGPIHTSKASRAALDARPWLSVEWLPKYAPELNDIEHAWRDLKRHFLAHQTFRDLNHLDRAIHAAVDDLNKERQSKTCANLRIAA